MPEHSKFFDYAPVNRSRDTNALDAESFSSGEAKSAVSEAESRFEGGAAEASESPRKKNRRQGPALVGDPVDAEAAAGQREHRILKRGHAVSFAGLFLFTFLVFFRPYEYSPALSWLSQSAFWVAVLTIGVFAPTQLALEGRFTARPREVNLILLLTLAGALSIPLALAPGRAASGFLEFVKVVMMFIVLINVVRTETRLRALLLLIFTVSFMLSIVALNDYRIGNLGVRGDRIEGAIGGLFDNPNDLALHLVTMIPLAFVLFLSSRSLIRKALWAAFALLMAAAVVVTFSRGGFLAMAFVAVVLGWKLAPRNRSAIIIGLILLIGSFVALGPGAFRERLSTIRGGDGSVSARQDELKRSLFIAIRHPVLGVGMDNYALFSNFGHSSHNSYTQVAADMGIAASVIYVLFIVAPLKRLRQLECEEREAKKKSQFYYLSIGLQASLLGFMVAGFFASVAYLWYVYYLVGYSVSLRRIREIQREKLAARDALA